METIYLLRDPLTNEPRYVGVTCRELRQRMRQHKNQANNGYPQPVYDWYRKLMGTGLAPIVEVIETTPDRSREAYWIAFYKERHSKMLNLAPGGNNSMSSNPEVAAKISAALKGRKLSDAHRLACLAGRVGYKHSDATKAKMRKPKSESHRKNAHKARLLSIIDGRNNPAKGDANGMRKHPDSVLRGEKNAWAKLLDVEVIEMRKLYADGAGMAALGRKFQVSFTNAQRIVLGKTWTHVGGPIGTPRGKGKKPWLKIT